MRVCLAYHYDIFLQTLRLWALQRSQCPPLLMVSRVCASLRLSTIRSLRQSARPPRYPSLSTIVRTLCLNVDHARREQTMILLKGCQVGSRLPLLHQLMVKSFKRTWLVYQENQFYPSSPCHRPSTTFQRMRQIACASSNFWRFHRLGTTWQSRMRREMKKTRLTSTYQLWKHSSAPF